MHAMATISPPSVSEKRPGDGIPPLRNGDRLSWPEFERRYDAMPHLKKAELIEGVVYMPSPVSEEHSASHFNLIGWLMHYAAATPGVVGGDNGTLRLDLDNAPQPDVFLRILPGHGGRSRVDEKGYVVGSPELVAELPKFAMLKTKFAVDRGRLPAALAAIKAKWPDAAADTLDGLRLDGPDWWLHVRPSNTEPVVRVIAEAPTEERVKALCDEAGALVKG